MKLLHPFLCLLVISAILLFSSCSGLSNGQIADRAEDTETEGGMDLDGALYFDGRRYTYTGEPSDICVKDDVLTIKRSGVYLLSGSLTQGRIAVDCVGEVCLVLENFEASSAYGAVVERSDGGSLCLSAVPNTVNILNCTYSERSEELPTSCVQVSGELCVLGEGRITVSSKGGSGLVCSDLRILGGDLVIGCAEYGMFAKNCIYMTDGSVTVSHARVGMYAFGGAYSKGDISLLGGRYTAVCKEIGIFAEGLLTLSEGISDIRAPLEIREGVEEN